MKRTIMCCLLLAALAPFLALADQSTDKPAKQDGGKQPPAMTPAAAKDTLATAADSSGEAIGYDPYNILNDDEDYWYYDQFDQDATDQNEIRRDRDNSDERDTRGDQSGRGD